MANSRQLPWSTVIQDRFGFATPSSYRLLESRNAFLWRKEFSYYANLTKPGEYYLWLNDMEWFPVNELHNFVFAEYQRKDFVPFAHSAGGDWWCWLPSAKNATETPVVLCPHDSYDADLYAPSFEAALWRQALEGATVRESSPDQGIYRAMLQRYFIDLADIWKPDWTEEIGRISIHEPCLLSWNEYLQLVGRYLGDDYLVISTIRWQS